MWIKQCMHYRTADHLARPVSARALLNFGFVFRVMVIKVTCSQSAFAFLSNFSCVSSLLISAELPPTAIPPALLCPPPPLPILFRSCSVGRGDVERLRLGDFSRWLLRRFFRAAQGEDIAKGGIDGEGQQNQCLIEVNGRRARDNGEGMEREKQRGRTWFRRSKFFFSNSVILISCCSNLVRRLVTSPHFENTILRWGRRAG